jgi:hypothetical protein
VGTQDHTDTVLPGHAPGPAATRSSFGEIEARGDRERRRVHARRERGRRRCQLRLDELRSVTETLDDCRRAARTIGALVHVVCASIDPRIRLA